jgi:hypothetical protein
VSLSGRFVLTVVLVCGGTYALVYLLAISPIYCAYSRSFVDAAPCYKYDLRAIKADVLLVGDSALLYGIRPSLVQQASSGISSYNYGMVGPSFTFDPQAIIDHYLATNSRPQAIVVYLSPWNRIERHRITDLQWFPLAVLTLRHGTLRDFFRLIRARPSAIVEVPPAIVRSIGLSTAPAKQRRLEMEQDGGHFNYSATLRDDNLALPADCAPATHRRPDYPYAADNKQAIAALRARYASQGIPLYVYIAPTASCDGEINEVRNIYAGVADNNPVALPDRYFADDTPLANHSHLNGDGVVTASGLLADFLHQRKLKAQSQNVKG